MKQTYQKLLWYPIKQSVQVDVKDYELVVSKTVVVSNQASVRTSSSPESLKIHHGGNCCLSRITGMYLR